MGILQKIRTYRDLADLLHQTEVLNSLQRWIDFPCDYSPTEYCTYGLTMALQQARHQAGGDQLTGQILLRAIFDYDIDVKTALAAVRHEVASPDIASSFSQTWPGSSWNSGANYSAITGTIGLPTRREATTTLLYAKRHRIPIEAVLSELALCEQNQVLIVRGLFGSPRQRLPHILADILAHPDNVLDRQRFSEINHVFIQDIGAFHAASIEDRDGAIANLHYSLALAHSLHAILLLKRGELLAGDQFHEANKQLLAALSRTNNVRVVISYEDNDELESSRDLRLPLINYRDVTMTPYAREHAVNAVHEYYDKYWRELGVVVEPNALDTVLQLEPAIYQRVAGILKRKALPYSLADLLNATIDTLRNAVASNTSSYLDSHARTAHDQVAKLLDPDSEGEGLQLFSSVDALDAIAGSATEDKELREKARKLYGQWLPVCETLGTLAERMQSLVDHPQLRKSPRTSQYAVTQDMVTAHLFSDPRYLMKLIKAFRDSMQLSDPDLLILIRKYVARAAEQQ
jgi:hypothetical protein